MKKQLLFLAAIVFATAALTSCDNGGEGGGGNPQRNEMVYDDHVYSFDNSSNSAYKNYFIYPNGDLQLYLYVELGGGNEYCSLTMEVPFAMIGKTTVIPPTGEWGLLLTGKDSESSWGTYDEDDVLAGMVKIKKVGTGNYEIDVELAFEDGKEFSAYYKGSMSPEPAP